MLISKLFPGQCGRVDPRGGERQRLPVRRQLFGVACAEAEAPRSREEARSRAGAAPQTRARVDSIVAEGPPGEEQSAAESLRRASRAATAPRVRSRRDYHPAGAAA